MSMSDPKEETPAPTLSEKLNRVSNVESECSIYRVHKHLRNVNANAYEPEIVSIGPYHRGKDDLKMMEDYKLRYLHSLVHRKNETGLEVYLSKIKKLEPKARECYAEHISLDAREFVELLVVDGCFIIELVRKHDRPQLRQKKDGIFRMDWIITSLRRDLMLFENQIPFFVLRELFDLIEIPNNHSRLTYLFLHFFDTLYPGMAPNIGINYTNVSSKDIKHLLHLIHYSWLQPFHSKNFDREEESGEKRWRFISSVAGLKDSNVKFEKNKGAGLFDIRFENGTMHITPLNIEDRTEALFRNLIAYEQYADHAKCPVADYVKLLDCLVDSSKDVEILSRLGIIENWLGDDEVVAKMVNRLSDLVAGPGNSFRYAEIFEKVNEHCGKRTNRWVTKLRRNYANSPWAIISICGGVLLLLLTIAQTVFSVLQVVY